MAKKNNDKVSLMDKSEFKTLDEFFKAEENNIKKVQQLRLKYAKDNAKAQEREMRNFVRRWTDEEETLRKAGIKDLHEYQMHLIKQRNEEDYKKRLEAENKIYKQQVENSKKSVQKQKIQDAINHREDNQAWLKLYDKLDSEGKLTSDQKEDRKRRQEELNLANKSLKEQQKQTAISKAINATMSATLNAVNVGINTYAKYQGGINARLQGSNLGGRLPSELRFGTNSFGVLENRLTSAVGIQPYVKTEAMLTNLDELVKTGIAANVEQRAFLNTVKDNIAETFNAANSSLLRIIRLQQSDSTAARLGMEAYLTRFLNQMVENTEYLSTTFDSVEEALIEASSQMTMQASTEFEYVVQKWLGALTGTGLSENTATQLAQAIGYLGSGNVEGFGSSSMQGLLTIAASRSGLDIGSILNNGLNARTTNALLNAIANYMVEIGGNSSNVVRSSLAQTFGLNISDIRAAQQLAGSFGAINRNMLSYGGMYGALNQQMLALPGRISTAEMIQNLFDNSFFSLAENIASNPALAAIWRITDLIESTTGGINIPAIEALTVGTGGMLDMNATVEQLMKLGIVGIGSLGMIGDVISGLGSTMMPSSMLQKLGIFGGNTAIVRGTGLASMLSGFATSQSSFVGNSAGGDVYQQTLQGGMESAQNNETLQPQQEQGDTEILPNIDRNVHEIMETLKRIEQRLDGEFEVRDTNSNAFNYSPLV